MKMKVNDKEVEADEVDVLTTNEPWREYQLSDGKRLRLKNILISVYKSKEKQPNGEYMYIVAGKEIIDVRD